jgi:hypothetical protein
MKRLTDLAGGRRKAFAGSYSPDDRHIVFRLEQGNKLGQGNKLKNGNKAALATIDPDGHNLRLLTKLGTTKPRYITGARTPRDPRGRCSASAGGRFGGTPCRRRPPEGPRTGHTAPREALLSSGAALAAQACKRWSLRRPQMAIAMGLDRHRAQITAEWIDTETGEVWRSRISPAHRAGVRRFAERFRGPELEVALEATLEPGSS